MPSRLLFSGALLVVMLQPAHAQWVFRDGPKYNTASDSEICFSAAEQAELSGKVSADDLNLFRQECQKIASSGKPPSPNSLSAQTAGIQPSPTETAKIAIAALECSYLAPDGWEEGRLMTLGYESALSYISFVRNGGEPDFSMDAAGQFINVIHHSYPNDDFSIGSFYTHLQYALDQFLDWAEIYSPQHMQHPSGKVRTAEFEIRNCRLLGK